MTAPLGSRTDLFWFTARVHGVPAPQGSKRAFVVNGRAVMTEASAKVRPWRETVVAEAVDVMNGRAPFDGAVEVLITFRMPKPKTVRRDLPHVKPDIDKLVRSTLDALTTAQVFGDDGQVTDLVVRKRYGIPGADITVRPVDDVAEVAA